MTSAPPVPRPARGTLWRGWTTPLDLAIAGGIGVWAILEALLVPSDSPIAQLAFAVAISAPLIVRRRLPEVVLLVVAAAFVAHAATAGADATFNPFPSLLVATFTVAERVARWWLAALLGVVPIAAMLGAEELGYFGSPGIEAAGVVFLLFFVGGTWAAGRIVRLRSLSAQTSAAGAAQRAAEAAASERRRIARELHDIVAHSLSIVALQAAAAERFVDRDPARARVHLDHTRRTAQSALDEMRHLLEVLREDDATYEPQPGLSALPDLVAETEAAGHPCRLTITHPERGDELPDGAALTVYRLVQEALTNARRHAPGAAVDVVVDCGDRLVEVTVSNGPPTSAHARPLTTGSGNGLPGMRERVRLYGGLLDAHATPEGGWRVHATLPLGVTR